jgi:hypothetical protein
MVAFKTTLQKFGDYGEKTGWTYIEIAAEIAAILKPGNKQIFRVRGKIDAHPINVVAVFPCGDGSFILPVNANMRNAIKKKEGAMIYVELEEDKTTPPLSADLLECLEDDANAKTFFYSLSPSHRSYFSKWIESAKTIETKSKRIAQSINALAENQDYSTMIRGLKKLRNE